MKKFFYELEALRGIAALLVVTFHAAYFFPPFSMINLFNKGYLMVDLFFVLSGFVISHNYLTRINEPADFKKFIVLRWGRVYPLHIATMLIWMLSPIIESITGDVGQKANVITTPTIVANIFLVQSLGFWDTVSINSPSWSISTEFYTYIIFGILLLFLKKQFKVIAVLIFVLAGIQLCFISKDHHFTSMLRCLYSFFLGVLTYFVFSAEFIKRSKLIPGPAISLLIMLAFLEIGLRMGDTYEYVIFPWICSLMILSFSLYEKSKVVQVLQRQAFQTIGGLSYSIYMLHGIFIVFYVRFFNLLHINTWSPGGGTVAFLLSLLQVALVFASILIASHYSYKWLEKPCRDKVRSWVSKKQFINKTV